MKRLANGRNRPLAKARWSGRNTPGARDIPPDPTAGQANVGGLMQQVKY